jgi:hypothetical protein
MDSGDVFNGEKEMEIFVTKKYIDACEFKELGYLQEVNRRFFHPLGLALEVETDDSTGASKISGIIDARDDEEGFVFDAIVSGEHDVDLKRADSIIRRKQFVDDELSKRCDRRWLELGWDIQPVSTLIYPWPIED